MNADRQSIERTIAMRLSAARATFITRVRVVDEAVSTQDEARAACDGTPGLMLLALRQTGGRGRLGRPWADPRRLGVAATFALDAAALAPECLPLAAGLAALHACADALARPRASCGLGLRWPNDVVEAGDISRKVAGVLIERSGAIAFVGVGINVAQHAADWTDDMRPRAISLSQLGAAVEVADVAAQVAVSLDAALHEPPGAIVSQWTRFDVLRGTRRTFIHDGHAISGVVEGIDPMSHIRLRIDDGMVITLPALTTSMVHEGGVRR